MLIVNDESQSLNVFCGYRLFLVYDNNKTIAISYSQK